MLIWSAKILLFIFSISLTSNNLYASIEVNSFLNNKNFHGTAPRKEYEYKFAVKLNENSKLNVMDLSKSIAKGLNKLIAENKFKFSKQIFEKYTFPQKFETFVFKDIYLDTNNYLLNKNNSAYRLRYRWVRQEKYYRYRLFPFLKAFYPDRCEIQFKGGYKRDEIKNTIAVNETRFEFRNQSEPFIANQSAPLAPWPESEYLSFAQTGYYKNYAILPMKKLIEQVSNKAKTVKLLPVIEVVTERFRTHLTIKNPWGIGPNPEHAFIITIDKASAKPRLKNTYNNINQLLEIEVEIDRNISTEINRLADLKLNQNSYEKSAQEFSQLAKNNIEHDLFLIKNEIANILQKNYQVKPLPVTNKYSRFINWLNNN